MTITLKINNPWGSCFLWCCSLTLVHIHSDATQLKALEPPQADGFAQGMATTISDAGDVFLSPQNHFRNHGIRFPRCSGRVGPSKSQVITHISFRGGKLPRGAGKGRKLSWHFPHVSGRYTSLLTQFCANLQFAVLGSFSLVSNQTHQNYSEVTVGNNTSFLLLQIKRGRRVDKKHSAAIALEWL